MEGKIAIVKMLRTQDRIFLLLGGIVDLFEEIRDPLGIFAYSYENLYGWVPSRFKKHNVHMSIKRALKTGYIEKVFKDGQPYLRLTGRGKKKLVRDFPLLALQKRKWDGRWRMVFFDIKETSRKIRDQLRRKLKELGLAKFQQSVYITPHNFAEDIREFLESRGLAESVYVVITKELLTGDEKALAQKLWNLKKINEEYRKILEFWEEEKISSQKEKIIREIKSRYLEILAVDPFLPKELLPSDWCRQEVESLLRRTSF